MRILRQGREVNKECKRCGTLFAFTGHDVQDCNVSGRTWVVCPNCYRYVYLTKEDTEPVKNTVDWDE